jgi:hypothetical protein
MFNPSHNPPRVYREWAPRQSALTIFSCPKSVAEWTEDDILRLPPGENDTFERKGFAALGFDAPKANEDKVLDVSWRSRFPHLPTWEVIKLFTVSQTLVQ